MVKGHPLAESGKGLPSQWLATLMREGGMAMLHVSMMQHPVGQGGFASGQVDLGSGSLRWAYDCGSNQARPLRREIDRMSQLGELRFLFLSHLDSDHISGVDRLLAQCDVEEVVLPHLDEEVILMTVARDAAEGRLNGLMIDAAGDLAGWFAGRGVRVVTFVGGNDDAGGDDRGPRLPGPIEPGGDAEGPVVSKWSGDVREIGERPSPRTDDGRPMVTRVQLAGPDALAMLSAGPAMLNWALIPFAHPPGGLKRAAFRWALEQEFGSPLSLPDILKEARNEAGRDRLRSCYDALWADHNLVSMTLYSGPVRQANFRAEYNRDHWGTYGSSVGWMLTGDAHLARVRRREKFFAHYAAVVDFTGVLMLPHHGSIHNFHPDLLLGFPQLEIGYAAAGPNSYGHPHPRVRRRVRRDAQFYRVGTKRRSELESSIFEY